MPYGHPEGCIQVHNWPLEIIIPQINLKLNINWAILCTTCTKEYSYIVLKFLSLGTINKYLFWFKLTSKYLNSSNEDIYKCNLETFK